MENEIMQLSLAPAATREQAEAYQMHLEALAAVNHVVESAAALGRKLAEMKERKAFRALGFETLEDYTEKCLGIRKRQAYNYMAVAEKVHPAVLEANAGAGVTKLALIAELSHEEQKEVAADGLAGITVAELKKIVAERDKAVEQLSFLQSDAKTEPEAEPVGTDPAEEVDLEAIRKEAAEAARKEAAAEIERLKQGATASAAEIDRLKRSTIDLAAEKAALKTDLAAEKKKAKEAAELAEKKAMAKAENEAEEKIRKAAAEAERAAAEKAKTAAEAIYHAQLAQAKEEAESARRDAERAMRELQAASSTEAVKVKLLFEQIREMGSQMLDIMETMDEEQSARLRKAAAAAFTKMAEMMTDES